MQTGTLPESVKNALFARLRAKAGSRWVPLGIAVVLLAIPLAAAELASTAPTGDPAQPAPATGSEARPVHPPMPPERHESFGGDCSYTESRHPSGDGWIVVEHVMRCVEKVRAPCQFVVDASVANAAEPSTCPRPAEPPCPPQPAESADARSGSARACLVEARPTSPHANATRPAEPARPKPAEPMPSIIAVVITDGGRYVKLENGAAIPAASNASLRLYSREPVHVSIDALSEGSPVAHFDDKIVAEHPWAAEIARLAHLGADRLLVKATYASGRMVELSFGLPA